MVVVVVLGRDAGAVSVAQLPVPSLNLSFDLSGISALLPPSSSKASKIPPLCLLVTSTTTAASEWERSKTEEIRTRAVNVFRGDEMKMRELLLLRMKRGQLDSIVLLRTLERNFVQLLPV